MLNYNPVKSKHFSEAVKTMFSKQKMSLAENLSRRDFPLLLYFKSESVNVITNKLGMPLGPSDTESLENIQTNEHPKTGSSLATLGGTGLGSSQDLTGAALGENSELRDNQSSDTERGLEPKRST